MVKAFMPWSRGTRGEICLRGPKITKGYWKDPAKTRVSFFGEWLRTGDVGYLDDDGFLYLTDCQKDMIISGGGNIASSEVERVIYQMPEVSAIIVPCEGSTLDLGTLAKHCRKHLAGFKVPKQCICAMRCRATRRAMS